MQRLVEVSLVCSNILSLQALEMIVSQVCPVQSRSSRALKHSFLRAVATSPCVPSSWQLLSKILSPMVQNLVRADSKISASQPAPNGFALQVAAPVQSSPVFVWARHASARVLRWSSLSEQSAPNGLPVSTSQAEK